MTPRNQTPLDRNRMPQVGAYFDYKAMTDRGCVDICTAAGTRTLVT